MKYNDIATREDRNFQWKCKRELGVHHYNRLIPKAAEAFRQGLRHPNQNKRENTARRLANLVFTNALLNKV